MDKIYLPKDNTSKDTLFEYITDRKSWKSNENYIITPTKSIKININKYLRGNGMTLRTNHRTIKPSNKISIQPQVATHYHEVIQRLIVSKISLTNMYYGQLSFILSQKRFHSWVSKTRLKTQLQLTPPMQFYNEPLLIIIHWLFKNRSSFLRLVIKNKKSYETQTMWSNPNFGLANN